MNFIFFKLLIFFDFCYIHSGIQISKNRKAVPEIKETEPVNITLQFHQQSKLDLKIITRTIILNIKSLISDILPSI